MKATLTIQQARDVGASGAGCRREAMLSKRE
jgi:hypothetical protein